MEQPFSLVSKQYLNTFYQILEQMIQGMTCNELTDSISYNFIVQMIPHHCAAIEMSQNLLQYTTDVPLQNIALQIVEEQTKSIAQMEAIQNTCRQRCNSEQDVVLYQRCMDQIMQLMFHRMETARVNNNINCSFMWEMIPHHEGAVSMSQMTLRFDICPDLKPILEAIVTSQRQGIRQMRRLLRCQRC